MGSFTTFTAIGLLLFGYKYLDFAARGRSVAPGIPLIEELTSAWTICLLFPFVRSIGRRFPLYAPGWPKRLPVHLVAVLLFSVGMTSIQWLARSLLSPVFGQGAYDYGIMPVRYLMELPVEIIIYGVALTAVYFWDRQVRTAQLESRLSEARLHNLRLQLQPHFLFNVLNTISSLMYSNPRAADRMIVSLAEVMRKSLAEAPVQEIPLQKEIEFINHYLELMRLRFEDSLRVDLTIEPGTEHALVPQLLLQPLIENAIRHGIDPETAIVQVSVRATLDGETLRLHVRDRGPGAREWPVRCGVGLSNTVERLSFLYGSKQRIEWSNCADGGFAVNVAVPFHV